MSDAITKLKQGQNLSLEESKSLFSDLMEGKHEEGQITTQLEALQDYILSATVWMSLLDYKSNQPLYLYLFSMFREGGF